MRTYEALGAPEEGTMSTRAWYTEFTRREFLVRVGAGGAGLAAASRLSLSPRPACAAELEKELVIVYTGGEFERRLKEHFYDPFTKATGVKISPVAATLGERLAKIKAMAAAKNIEWDIVALQTFDLPALQQFLTDLGDCSSIPNVEAQGVPGTCQRYGALNIIGGIAIAYNTDVFPPERHPKSWADFWEVKKFPGPRALPNYGNPENELTAALMADGVPPDKLYPLDLDRAFRKMDEIKPHVKVWWKTGDQSQQIMKSREVVLNVMWSGRILSLKAAGVPIGIEWNQANKDVSTWTILKDAPHPKAARAFIDFFMERPEAHRAFSRAMFYATPNRKAVELMPQAERPTMPTYEENWKRMVDKDAKWLQENRARVLERWNKWLAE